MKLRSLAIISTLVLSGVTFTACTLNIGDSNNGGNHMMNQGNSKLSGSDIMFAQMMIPHHQQAVEMGILAVSRASNPEVKALAAQIKNEQAPEITQMKGWLRDSNAGLDMGHEMAMGGMLSDTEFEALKASKGAAFDKLYLERMIGHHEGAIQMANMVLDSKNAEVKALGEAIVDSQTKQITYMKALLKKLG